MIGTDLKQYLEAKLPELNGRIYPVLTTKIKTLSVLYKVVPIEGGHLKQSQLELIVTGKDYDECKSVEEKLLSILDMEEDEPFQISGTTRFHSGVSGGGILWNDSCQMWEDTLYFIVKWRKISG